MRRAVWGAASVLLAGAAASATPVLQFDVNQFGIQAQNAANVNVPFGGLTHTGRLLFTAPAGTLNGIFIQSIPSGPFNNAGFAGFTLTSFTGQVTLNNGLVTGGSVTLTLNNGDFYTCNITPGSGAISTTTLPGGFKIEGLTRNGAFADSVFGNVNVAPWFNTQGFPGGLPGSFLEFNFSPNASGAGNSDMDLFVDVAPLPPAAWAGLGTLAGVIAVRRLRRR